MRSTTEEADYVAYRRACRVANKAIIKARQDFYSRRKNDAGLDSRRRWSLIGDVLRQTERDTIEHCVDCQTLADFFVAKVENIKAAIRRHLNGDTAQPTTADAIYGGQPLAELSAPSVDEVTRHINAMPAKSSPVDTIPTLIIKSCVDVFAPLIKRLAELSLN